MSRSGISSPDELLVHVIRTHRLTQYLKTSDRINLYKSTIRLRLSYFCLSELDCMVYS